MKNLINLNIIKALFEKGGNIIEHLKSIDNANANSLEHILISYDFQAGSYIDFVENNPEYVANYTSAIAVIINNLGNFNSILEIGVGEATTLGNLVPKVNSAFENVLGLDCSWSRLRYGKKYLRMKNIENVILFTSDLFNIPLAENSIDIVYTSHSIEPNGGKEKEALEELYRVASKYVILLEPSYNFGNDKAKERIQGHGYVKTLHQTALDLGYEVLEYRLFDYCANELNPTELIVIQKNKASEPLQFSCPISREKLRKGENEYYSENGMLIYPVISNIPCLLSDNAIIATKYSDFL